MLTWSTAHANARCADTDARCSDADVAGPAGLVDAWVTDSGARCADAHAGCHANARSSRPDAGCFRRGQR